MEAEIKGKLRILEMLQEVLGEAVMAGEEVDITAKKVFDKFINPVLLFNEMQKTEIRELKRQLNL